MNRVKGIILIAAASIALGAVIFAIAFSSSKGKGTGENLQGETSVDNTLQEAPGTQETAEQTGDTELQEDGTEQGGEPDEQKEPVKARAVYLSGPIAGSTKHIDHFIDLVNKTELNALVIDIKEAGYVNFASEVPEVQKHELYKKYYNPRELLQKLHDNGIYVIGRLVVFRDPGLAAKRTDLAIKKADGSLWTEGKLGPWTNPYNEEVWRYNIDIAKEAVELGFDEIQFDYVRFPTSGKTNQAVYGENMPEKYETINKFLGLAANELDAAVSADVFGIICESVPDGKAIGQHLEAIGMEIDYISPMVYPSHYAVGQTVNGVVFSKPDFEPYAVVYNTLVKCRERLAEVEGYKAKVRPYLQDFTASYLKEGLYKEYGVEEVREQIKAVYDAGYEEWILWDGRNTYTEDALLREE